MFFVKQNNREDGFLLIETFLPLLLLINMRAQT